MNKLRLTKGFTLVELIIVIAVIGILVSGTIVLINPVARIQKANDTKRINDLNQLEDALQLYYSDNGVYPDASVNNKIMFGGSEIDWGTNGFAPYINTLPGEPGGSSEYVYTSDGDQIYRLYTHLQQPNEHMCTAGDPTAACTGAGVDLSTVCGGDPCNFGVTSPNTSP